MRAREKLTTVIKPFIVCIDNLVPTDDIQVGANKDEDS